MKNICIICAALSEPGIHISGLSAIYNLIKQLAEYEDIQIDVVSSLHTGSDPLEDTASIHYHYVRSDWLPVLRTLLYWKALQVCCSKNMEIVHDFSSIPAFAMLTGVVGKICGAKSIHTLSTVSASVWGNPRYLILPRVVEQVTCVDLITKRKIEGYAKDAVYTPLGGNFAEFLKLDQHEARGATKKTLFIGPLEKRKGAQILAKAVSFVLKKNKKTEFVFATYGKDPRDPNFKDNFTKLKKMLAPYQDKVSIPTGRQNIPDLMKNTDIFVLPATSRHGTLGQPLTLLEAMAAAKPCIVSDIYKGAGLVKDGENCLLFESGNADDLAKKINILLEDTELKNSISVKARETIINNFTVDKCSADFYNIYTNMIV